MVKMTKMVKMAKMVKITDITVLSLMEGSDLIPSDFHLSFGPTLIQNSVI